MLLNYNLLVLSNRMGVVRGEFIYFYFILFFWLLKPFSSCSSNLERGKTHVYCANHSRLFCSPFVCLDEFFSPQNSTKREKAWTKNKIKKSLSLSTNYPKYLCSIIPTFPLNFFCLQTYTESIHIYILEIYTILWQYCVRLGHRASNRQSHLIRFVPLQHIQSSLARGGAWWMI